MLNTEECKLKSAAEGATCGSTELYGLAEAWLGVRVCCRCLVWAFVMLFLSLSLLTAAAQRARGQGCVCNNVVAVVVHTVVSEVLMSIEKVEDALDWQLDRE